MHAGTICVRSEGKGMGTTFTVELPRSPPGGDASRPGRKPPGSPSGLPEA